MIIRRGIVVAMSTAVLLAGHVATSAHADAVADCAKIEGKALGALLDALLKEGSSACTKGAGAAPRPVSRKAVGTMMGKYFAGIGGGIDRFGPGACGISYLQLTAENIFTSTQAIADQACLVP